MKFRRRLSGAMTQTTCPMKNETLEIELSKEQTRKLEMFMKRHNIDQETALKKLTRFSIARGY